MSEPVAAFEYAKLGEHADILAGPPFNSDAFTDKPEDVPLVKGENVQQGYVDWNIAKRWPITNVDAYKRFSLVPGDVVVAMDRPWVTAGLKWAYLKRDDPPALLVQRVARLRGKKTLDQGFLRCLISSQYFSNYIQPIVTGVNVPHISGKQIGDFKIPIPTLATQKKIAAILSAYDDLIANNQRRITLLERMAEDIYREWFVRLRFPGHEQVKIEKGIPQGWHFADLSEMAGINTSSIRKGTQSERIFYIDISAVSTNHIDDLTDMALADAPARARRLVKHGDVVWSSVRPANRAYCLIYEPPENLVASTGFAVISPKRGFPFTFINFAVTSDSFVEQMAMVAKGSAYPATSFDDFGKAKIICPSPALLARFHEICEPMFKRRHQLRLANAALAKQRDALLPRLISGKLAVDLLDIQYPPGMVTPA